MVSCWRSSFVEQAAITGEAMPVEKTQGDVVYAGTMNQSGALEIGAQKLGRDTTFGRSLKPLNGRKIPGTDPEDRRSPGGLSRLLRPRSGGSDLHHYSQCQVNHFGCNRGRSLWHRCRNSACNSGRNWPRRASGAIIKGGLYLEALAAVDTVLLDKTGTLTFGTPQIREVLSTNGFGERQIIAAASIAERKSEHPLAKAVMARAAELAITLVEPDEFSYTPGRGVRVSYQGEEILVGSRALLLTHGFKRILPIDGNGAGGVSEVYVTRGGQVLGTIRIADVLRPEAKNAVAAMREMGLKTILLSGDAQAVPHLWAAISESTKR